MREPGRRAEILLNVVGTLALLVWLAGAGVIAWWLAVHPPVTVNGSRK